MEVASQKENSAQIFSAETSKRITSLRYLLIVLVVFIHANLGADDAINYYHYDFVQPYWVGIVKNFICIILGGSAVPLFFFLASFLQFSKNDKYKILLKKRSKSVFLPYIIWTCITIILYFIAQLIPETAPFFQNPTNIVKNWKGIDWLKVFTYNNLSSDLKAPFVYQFWFLRELMIFIILSPILKFLCDKFSALIVVLVSVAALKGIPLFFTVSPSALFFYLAGYYCAKYKIDFFKISDKIKIYEYLFLFILVVTFNIIYGGKYDFGSISTIISCLFFLKLSSYFIRNDKIYSTLNYLSGYSFFLYAIHTPFLGTAINKITQRIIPLHGIFCLIQFLLAAFLTILIGTLAGIVLKKICFPLFCLLNGGRK
ncbi:MAG: acyltransferase family protein [Treponemataceae bacterium]